MVVAPFAFTALLKGYWGALGLYGFHAMVVLMVPNLLMQWVNADPARPSAVDHVHSDHLVRRVSALAAGCLIMGGWFQVLATVLDVAGLKGADHLGIISVMVPVIGLMLGLFSLFGDYLRSA